MPAINPKEDGMSAARVDGNSPFRLTFDGSMTINFANELEDRILDAMRQHALLEVDLSGVREIDLCGIHLLRLLQTLGGKAVSFVAISRIVENAIKGLPGIGNLTQHRQGLALA
jgi:ABC-type transporter Mla MlaB component